MAKPKSNKHNTSDCITKSIYTEKSSVKLTRKMVVDLWTEAYLVNKIPIIKIGLKDNDKLWKLNIEIQKETIHG
jgi:hypothetical protein